MWTIFQNALELLFPTYCVLCGRALNGDLLCKPCTPETVLQRTVHRCRLCYTPINSGPMDAHCDACKYSPTLFSALRYLWDFEGQARQLINYFKYHPSLSACRRTAHKSAPAAAALLSQVNFDCMVPIPPSFSALVQRGFSPCDELAESIKAHLDQRIPILFNALRQNRRLLPQASLAPNKRFRNRYGSFAATGHKIAGRNVLLIDDVMTTGATAAAAARALLDAGARTVAVYSLARSATFAEHRAQLAQA